MGRKLCVTICLLFLLALGAGTSLANEPDKDISFLSLVMVSGAPADTVFLDDTDQDLDYPWRAHEAPFDNLFGNMIDGHQQTQLVKDGKLKGFIYVEYLPDEQRSDGLPVARKVNCASSNRTVGWVVKGIPISAQLVNKSPRIWLVNPAELPVEGGYTHFHWTGPPQKPHGLLVGNTYEGYLMKRIAPTPFFWLGGGGSSGGHSGGGCGGEEGGCGGEEGGCGGEEGGCGGEEGGCGGEEGGCGGEEGGCGGEEGGCGGEEGGCSGEEGGCEDDGGCSGEEGGCSGEEGGCEDDGGCSGDEGGCGGDEGGCSGGGGSGGSSHGGHSGRVVPEGVDPHSNIVTDWDGSWQGCGGDDGGCSDGGCGGDDGGCSDGGCSGD
jgi:hypothetical protein